MAGPLSLDGKALGFAMKTCVFCDQPSQWGIYLLTDQCRDHFKNKKAILVPVLCDKAYFLKP